LYCFQWTYPVESPNIPYSKSHIPFPLPRSFQRIHPIPRSCVTFCNQLVVYGEELLAPCPTPKLEDHPLSAVHGCSFNIFTPTLHIWRTSPSATQGYAMPMWQELT
jgi:hypothetical protein